MTEVEVDEMLCLCEVTRESGSAQERQRRKGMREYSRTVGNKASEVAADDAVPCWALPVVEL